MSAFIITIQRCTGSPIQSNQARKRNERRLNWKGRSKAISILNDIILYVKKIQLFAYMQKLLELIKQIQQSCRVQDQNRKNQLCSYILAMNSPKWKLRKHPKK